MSTVNPSTNAVIAPKRAIGGIYATITIEEAANDEMEITQHPVQTGATISDHAFKKPETLSIKIMFSPYDAPLDETYQKLLDLQSSKKPFDVVTGKRIYRDMLIKSIGQTTDKETENCLSITLDLIRVIIVNVEIVTVPPRENHNNEKSKKTGGVDNTGKKSGTYIDSVNDPSKANMKKSSLNILFK